MSCHPSIKTGLFFLIVIALTAANIFNLPIGLKKLNTTLIAHAVGNSLSSPVILSVSESVSAGDTMNIQGGGFDLRSVAWLQLIKSDGSPDVANRRQLLVVNQSPYLIQSVVPSDMPTGLWSVTVQNPDGSVSVPKYVHQARGNGFDHQEVAAGSALRIWGMNMIAPGGTFNASYATFTNGQTVLTAPATAGDAYGMTINVPSNVVVGTVYVVKVNNGLGGTTGENPVPYPLTIRTGGSDPFALGVPWGADFAPFAGNVHDVTSDALFAGHFLVFDGSVDDEPNLQYQIQVLGNNGGGVLYFPAGTYFLDSSLHTLEIQPNTVLKGAGRTQTILEYGKTASANDFMMIDNPGKIGILNLAIKDLSTSSTLRSGGIGTTYRAISNKIFFKDISYSFGPNAGGLGCYCNQSLLTGSIITDQTIVAAPLGWGGTDGEITNNTVTFGGGRNVINGDNMTSENNVFHRDGNLDNPQQNEDGALELSYSRSVQVLNNDISITGPVNDALGSNNSNELILSQNSVFNLGILGLATSATSTTLSDASKDWSDPFAFFPDHAFNVEFFRHPTVAIIGGTGMGQWRNITPNDIHSLNVDRPWDILPDSTSKYVISRWTADRFSIRGNTLSNGKCGVCLVSGSNDSVINGNTLTNTGPIAVYGSRDGVSQPPSTHNYVVWNNKITANFVNDTTGNSNPAQIFIGAGLDSVVSTDVDGNLALDNEVRGNSLTAHTLTYSLNGPYTPPGYYNYIFAGGSSASGPDRLGIIGSIFEKNTATNTSAQPFISMGTSQNTEHYAGEPTLPPCLTLKLADRTTANQAKPGVTVKYFKAGTEELIARTENWPSNAVGTTLLNDPFLTGLQAGQAAAYPMLFRNSGTYDVWIKAPGFLAKKVPGVTNVQTVCISMLTGLTAGDFSLSDKNIVDVTDIVTWIRAFDGGTDSAAWLASNAYGAPLTINSLATLIRTFRTAPVGDLP